MISAYGFSALDSGSTLIYMLLASPNQAKYAISYNFLFFGKLKLKSLSN
jgi:hypothetical protein